MRKFGLLLIGAALTLVVFMAPAFADKPPSPPGQGECAHGNSGKECKPDPQPDHGKDCEEHGNNGGVNEDHCSGTTTETTTTTTTVAVDPCVEDPESCQTETETTTTTVVTSTTQSTPPPVESTTTTTTAPPAESTAPPTKTGGTTDSPSDTPQEKKQPGTSEKLAFTGIEDVVPLAGAALALLTGGTGLLWLGRKRDAE